VIFSRQFAARLGKLNKKQKKRENRDKPGELIHAPPWP
jgi:hypothetical protein